MRSFLVTLSLLTLLMMPVLAQSSQTVTIDYSDGRHLVQKGLSLDQATDLFLEFLRSEVDGRYQVSDQGKVHMDAVKKNGTLQLTTSGGTQTGLVSEALANFERARAAGHLGACRSNLKNIATALEMWATDHQENYPDTLTQLTPDYLVRLVRCPTGTSDYSYRKGESVESFELHCTGDHSGAAVPSGYPSYDSDRGLIDEPGE
jgi:hypothetical protein